MCKLPRVTAETVRAMEEAVNDGNQMLMMTYLQRIDRENPHVANQIRLWVKTTGLDPVPALMGAVTVYELLRAQAEVDAVKL